MSFTNTLGETLVAIAKAIPDVGVPGILGDRLDHNANPYLTLFWAKKDQFYAEVCVYQNGLVDWFVQDRGMTNVFWGNEADLNSLDPEFIMRFRMMLAKYG